MAGMHGILEGAGRWFPADGIPERELTDVRRTVAVVAGVDVETDQDATFRALTDPAVYSRWLGVPVTIRDGRFAATMEWGTEVRGTYDLISPPELIAMRWDFEDDNVPLPGGGFVGYLRLSPRSSGGSHVEVHQLVDVPEQALFMETAWAMVLGRLKAGVAAALDPAERVQPRGPRRKRRESA